MVYYQESLRQSLPKDFLPAAVSPKESSLDIFRFYSPENTINFLREQRIKGATDRELSTYLWREVEQTMGEFAFQEKAARILYFLGADGRLYPENVFQPAEEIYQKSAFGDREKAELAGFLKIEEMFAKGEANLALWLSPPSLEYQEHGDYGFVFLFAKNERVIEEYIFRYSEDKRTLKTTFGLYQKLYPLTFSSEKFLAGEEANFFLADPRFIKSDDPKAFMFKVLKNLGFTDVDSYLKTRKTLESDPTFQELFQQFRSIIFSLMEISNDPSYYFLLSQAKTCFAQLYNRACDLAYEEKIKNIKNSKENSIGETWNYYQSIPLPPPGFGDLNRKPLVLGRGSCPAMTKITKDSNWFSFSSHYSLAKSLTGAYEEYKFDHKGICVICKQGPKLLGPCNICQDCDKRMKK